MALETVVFQQDPFIDYGCKRFYNYEQENFGNITNFTNEYFDSSSPEVCAGDVMGVAEVYCPVAALASPHGKRKRRRRSRSTKNKEEIESQRMTHITVERNRRKKMNEYLAEIRSLIPPSYALRGDQASIVGGAINFVKVLEQLLRSLEAENKKKQSENYSPNLFANFFTFPQYSTRLNLHKNLVPNGESMGETPSTIADVEVSMVETHANIKILSRKQPKQLLKIVAAFYSLGLNILHLNVTSADDIALYSFSAKVEDEARLGTVNDVAHIIHEMMGKIRQLPMSS